MSREQRQYRGISLLTIILLSFSAILMSSHSHSDITTQLEALRAENEALKTVLAWGSVESPEPPQQQPVITVSIDAVELLSLTRDYQELCQIVEAEATGEGLEGKIAVAEVILNRVRSGQFGSTIHDVIYAPGQFDPVEDGRMAEITVTAETRDAVDTALKNRTMDALYFMNPKTSGPVSRGWAKRLQQVAVIGNHNFYK